MPELVRFSFRSCTMEWTVEDVRGKVQSKFNEDIARKREGKCKYKLK